MDEESAKFCAEQLQKKPIESWDIKEMLKKNDQLLLGKMAESDDKDDPFYEDDDN